ILILAREAGHKMELSDVHVDRLLPEKFFEPDSVEEFMKMLPEVDALMEEKRSAAAEVGKRLRYVARVEDGKAEVRLMEVGPEHPAYALSASDNLVMVNSDCYNDRPLVVVGPGAGPEVTASGVLADIIKVS
ncbi:MAG: hypothetical protein LAT57_08980, partial [Balneolales bacterium]|nr:hypothetical protein [Balneolales bacterium]